MNIKCNFCGGDVAVSADKTFATCEYCGTTVTVPRVSDEQRAAAFNRGSHFRRIGEFDKALASYERILREDDTDAEAHWCAALCRFGIEYVEDPATFEWLPTCHRASFDSFLEDVDYKAALEHSDGLSRRLYQKEAAKIAEVQRGILATSQNEEPYDVFLCYKETGDDGNRTRDSILAQDIYYQLTDQGHRVFFARITLEDKGGSQYEPYIFAALNSAKVMVAVGTKPEHFSAVWVKNEWSRFLALMRRDHSRVLLPCYRDMDPYDLPEQLAVLQSYDMGKIGFIQDLIRGVDKVVKAGKAEVPAAAPVVVQQTGGSMNINALVKRGYMALEDMEWDKAGDFFEDALNQDAECAEAYLGNALVFAECSNLNSLVSERLEATFSPSYETKYIPENTKHIDLIAAKYVVTQYLDERSIKEHFNYDRSYESAVTSRQSQNQSELERWNRNRDLVRAERFATGDLAEIINTAKLSLFSELEKRIAEAEAAEATAYAACEEKYASFLAEADAVVQAVNTEAQRKREDDYNVYAQDLESCVHVNQLSQLAVYFEGLGGYKDSTRLAQVARAKIQHIMDEQEQQRIESVRRKQLEAQKAQEAKLLAIRNAKRKQILQRCSITGLIIGIIIWASVSLNNRNNAIIENVQSKLLSTRKFSQCEQWGYSMGEDYEYTIVEFEDSDTAILSCGVYTWPGMDLVESYWTETHSYHLQVSLFGKVSLVIDGEKYPIEFWDDGSINYIDFYDWY